MKTWTTKDGSVINIKDMTDGHILNTISYFFRIADTTKERIAQDIENIGWSALSYSSSTNGDMASYYSGIEGDNLLNKAEDIRSDKRYVIPDALVFIITEALRRKLIMPENFNTNYITITEIKNDY